MADIKARIVVLAGGKRQSFDLDNLDFDSSRKSLSLKIGNRVTDAIYNAIEGDEE